MHTMCNTCTLYIYTICLVSCQNIRFQWFCFVLVLQCITDLSTSIYMLGLGFVTLVTFIFLVCVHLSWALEKWYFVTWLCNVQCWLLSMVTPVKWERSFDKKTLGAFVGQIFLRIRVVHLSLFLSCIYNIWARLVGVDSVGNKYYEKLDTQFA